MAWSREIPTKMRVSGVTPSPKVPNNALFMGSHPPLELVAASGW
jgi:hypothetical protein